jgi:hypothetical protein
MTALEPERRPRAAAVADGFANRDATADRTSVMPVPVVASEPAPLAGSPVRNRRGPLIAALAALVIALSLILFFIGSNERSGKPPATADTSTTVAAVTPPSTVTTPPSTAPRTQPTRPEPPRGKGKHGDNQGDG